MPSSTIVHLTWAALFLHTFILATIPEPVSRLWKWLFPSDVDRLDSSPYDSYHKSMEFVHTSLCINSMHCVIPWWTTNGSMAFVVRSTNDSREFVDHSGGGAARLFHS